MKSAAGMAALLALTALAGCASPGTAEDFTWTVESPSAVDKGSEFHLTVRASKSGAEGSGLQATPIDGIAYHWQIRWTGGTSAPLRHAAMTGDPVKIRARMVPGPATILITSANREGLDVKVAEATVTVK